MKVLTPQGRYVSVAGGAALSVSARRGSALPDYAGKGSVSLTRDHEGRPRRVRHAIVARANPWVMASINARAGVGSRIPMHVFRPDERPGERIRVRHGEGGPGDRLAALMVSPERGVSARRFKRRELGDTLTHGNGLIELVRSGTSIVAMVWQPWVDVEPVFSRDGLTIEAFEVPVQRSPGGGLGLSRFAGPTRFIDQDDAIHLSINDDTESPLGVSPIHALRATHALHDAAWRFAKAYLDEGVFPSGVVELPHNATLAQAAVTRRLIEELHTGPDQAGKPMLLGFGTWKQLMATPEGAKLVELAKASRDEVGAAFRTSLAVLGDLSTTNKASAEVAFRHFIRNVVGEDVDMYESEVQAQLVLPNRRWSAAGLWVEAQLGEMLKPDLEALAKIISMEVGAPIATRNEGRKWVGLPRHHDPMADELILDPGTPDTTSLPGRSATDDDEDDDE